MSIGIKTHILIGHRCLITILILSINLQLNFNINQQKPTVMENLQQKNLVFIAQMSVGAIKEANAGQPLKVLKNAATGKLFFACGATTGAVSTSPIAEVLAAPVISKVSSPDTGEEFLLLHKLGEGGAETVATL